MAGDERGNAWQRLTPREREICKALAKGFTNRQLAEELGITEHTVRNHARAIFRTLQVHTRGQVIAWYLLENPFASQDEKTAAVKRRGV